VLVVDVASGQVVDVIDPTEGGTVEVSVERIAITPDGKWAVISNPVVREEFSGSVTIVGTTEYPPPCPGLGLAPDDGEAWMGSNNYDYSCSTGRAVVQAPPLFALYPEWQYTMCV
jgi:hypothetical protein